MTAGAVAAISALLFARRRELVMPGMLSVVICVTARSMPVKTYQATALAIAVIAAMAQKATTNLVLTPRRAAALTPPAGSERRATAGRSGCSGWMATTWR